MEGSRLVFVYGTLRQGEPFHHLLEAAHFVDHAHTPPHYSLVNVGRYPGLVAGGHSCVAGELYRVDGKTTAILDDYEGHPLDYLRQTITLSDDTKAETYIFQPRGEEFPVIESGDWRNR